jgi:uncharacterized protein (UPF0261 family)
MQALTADGARQTASRQLIRVPHHINAPEFAAALVGSSSETLHGDGRCRDPAGEQ